MTHKRGRKRSIRYDLVLAYAMANPAMFQSQIATHFGVSDALVRRVLRSAGVWGIRRGRQPKKKATENDEQHKWERILHDHGLGMERGARIHKQRVLYGFDPLKERSEDESATRNSTL